MPSNLTPAESLGWQVRYYLPKLAGKALTKNLHASVAAAFTDRFGAYAGWAHNTLFISELASHRHLLPEHLRAPTPASGRKGGKGAAAEKVVFCRRCMRAALALP